jgi:hypothetical protein
MKNFIKKRDYINNKIVNLVLSAQTIFGTFSVGSVFLRDYPNNLDNKFYIQYALLFIAYFITYFRNKFSMQFKLYYVVLGLTLIMINAMMYLGFLASSKIYIVLCPVVTLILLDLRKAIIWFAILTSLYLFFAYQFITGGIIYNIDVIKFINSPKAWITDGIILFITLSCLFYIIHNYKKFADTNIDHIVKQNKKLENAKKGIIRHRDLLQQKVEQKTKSLDSANNELKSTIDELFNQNDLINKQNSELQAILSTLNEAKIQISKLGKIQLIDVLQPILTHEGITAVNYLVNSYFDLHNLLKLEQFKDNKALNNIQDNIEKAVSSGVKIAFNITETAIPYELNLRNIIEKSINNCCKYVDSEIKINTQFIDKHIKTKSQHNYNFLYLLYNNLLLCLFNILQEGGQLTVIDNSSSDKFCTEFIAIAYKTKINEKELGLGRIIKDKKSIFNNLKLGVEVSQKLINEIGGDLIINKKDNEIEIKTCLPLNRH